MNPWPNYDRPAMRNWMALNWTISLYGVGLYVVFIYFGTAYMKNRKPMDLKHVMAAWNFALSTFSIMASVTVVPEFLNALNQPNGFHHTICAPGNDVTPAFEAWASLFCMSKMVELIDTVFIVLRKRKLIFLHWYHHITVLIYCFYSYSDEISIGRWFIVVNYFVHALMYTYYSLRSLGIRVPRPIAMTITTLQLSQMVVGVITTVYAVKAKLSGAECDVSHHHLVLAAIMYTSYLVLFAQFFRKVYLN